MELEKRDVEKLLGRLDDILVILKSLSEDIKDISKILGTRSTMSSGVMQRARKSEQMTLGADIGDIRNVENVRRIFPQDLVRMLDFTISNDNMIIKPRQYLGSENFVRIATIVRDRLNGEYVSQGRDSHFRVPLEI